MHPKESSLARILPLAEEQDMRLDSESIDSSLYFYEMLRKAQGMFGCETTPWSSLLGEINSMIRQAASIHVNANRRAGDFDGAPNATRSHSRQPFGVTVPHVGSNDNGHFMCALYSFPARTVVIYDSLFRESPLVVSAKLEFSRSSPAGNFQGLVSGQALDSISRLPPEHRCVAWRIIAWLTVDAASTLSSASHTDKNRCELAIRDALASQQFEFGYRTWRIEVRPSGEVQAANDCGAMALATVAALVAQENFTTMPPIMTPIFYRTSDMQSGCARPFSAEEFCDSEELCTIGFQTRCFMNAPRSTVLKNHAIVARASLGTIFRSSRGHCGEDYVDARYDFYTLRVVAEEVLSRHVLLALDSLPRQPLCVDIYYDREYMKSAAERLSECLRNEARLCGFRVSAQACLPSKRAFSLAAHGVEVCQGEADHRRQIMAVYLSECDCDTIGQEDVVEVTQGANFLETHCANVPTVVNALLFRNVSCDQVTDEIADYRAGDDNHFWTAHVSSLVGASSDLAQRKRVRCLADDCSFSNIFDTSGDPVTVSRAGDVVNARYCSLGGLTEE